MRKLGFYRWCTVALLAACWPPPAVLAQGRLLLGVDNARGERGGIVELVIRAYSPRPMGQGQMCVRVNKRPGGALSGIDSLIDGARVSSTAEVAAGPFAEVLGASIRSSRGDAVVGVRIEENAGDQLLIFDFSSPSASINLEPGALIVVRARLRDDLLAGDLFGALIEVENTVISGEQGEIEIDSLPGTLRIVSGQGNLPAGGVVRLTNRDFAVLETAASAVVTVERSGGTAGLVEVFYSTEATTASEGIDYHPVAGSVRWNDGERGVKSIPVPILRDSLVEVTETFDLFLQGISGDALLDADRSRGTVSIGDVPPPGAAAASVLFVRKSRAVTEAGGPISIEVARAGNVGAAASVNYETTNGSAAESDFVPASGVLSWPPDDGGSRFVQLGILDDSLVEGNESFVVQLLSPSGVALAPESARIEVEIVDDDAGPAAACVPGPFTLCLLGGRFAASVVWRAPLGTSGRGIAIPSTASSGLFWFFNSENVELLLKMLDACSLDSFKSYWVFVAATTNVDFSLQVTDTQTGVMREFQNPQGHPADPVQDTEAFKTCPDE